MGGALSLLTNLFGDLYLRSYSPPEAVLTQARGYLFWMRFTILLADLVPFAPQFLNVEDPVLAGWVVTGIRWLALDPAFISRLYPLTSY